MYLGQSREHASNISYVLNTGTDHISSQHHVIYDDIFATMSVQIELQELNLWKDLNKTQPKLSLVNQLPNKNKFNSEEQDPLLNVMDLNNTSTTGLVNPELFNRQFDNPRINKNRKSTKFSNSQSRDTKVCKLNDKDTDKGNIYRVCHQLAPETLPVSTSHLLSKINLKKSVQSERSSEQTCLEEGGQLKAAEGATNVAEHMNTNDEKDLSNIVKQTS